MTQSPEDSLLTVKRLCPHDLATAVQWDSFVRTCPEATFFHRAGWQKIVQDIFHHDTYFLYVEAGGRIQGVLPLGHVKSWLFGNSLVGMPFAVYGGVAAVSAQAAEALEFEAQKIAVRLGVSLLNGAM